MDTPTNTPTDAPEKRDIKLLFVDLDGTLLNDQHSLSDRNREAIQAAMQAGVQVVLATGKTRISANSVIAALDLKTPGVFVQGVLIYTPEGNVRHQQTLDVAVVRRIITFAESRGFDVIIYSGNRLLAKANAPHIDKIANYGEPMPEAVGPLVNIITSTPVHKLIIVKSGAQKLKALRWQLDKQFEGDISMTTAAVLDSIEVLPAGVSKGKSAKRVAKELGISAEHVMAIGDAENDVEMLQFASWGVAVGNAADAVKSVADVVVASNADDGVAEAIERFILGKSLSHEEEMHEEETQEEMHEEETHAADSDAEATETSEGAPSELDNATPEATQDATQTETGN